MARHHWPRHNSFLACSVLSSGCASTRERRCGQERTETDRNSRLHCAFGGGAREADQPDDDGKMPGRHCGVVREMGFHTGRRTVHNVHRRSPPCFPPLHHQPALVQPEAPGRALLCPLATTVSTLVRTTSPIARAKCPAATVTDKLVPVDSARRASTASPFHVHRRLFFAKRCVLVYALTVVSLFVTSFRSTCASQDTINDKAALLLTSLDSVEPVQRQTLTPRPQVHSSLLAACRLVLLLPMPHH